MKNYILISLVAFLLAGCAVPVQDVTVLESGTARTATVRKTEKSAALAKQADAVEQTDDQTVEQTDDVTQAAAALAYLEEVALSGFEFGSAPHVAYKWTHDIEVSVSGSPSESDKAAFTAILADLNDLIAPLKIKQVATGGDITIWYGKDSEFARRLPGYTPGNRGYFQVTYAMDHSLTASSILISTEVDAAARAHLVREELTQSLGFFCDSWADEASIFYQGWTTTSKYTEQDKAIIRMLYDRRIKPGMKPTQVKAILGA